MRSNTPLPPAGAGEGDKAHLILVECRALSTLTYAADMTARQNWPGVDFVAAAKETVLLAENQVDSIKNPYAFWLSRLRIMHEAKNAKKPATLFEPHDTRRTILEAQRKKELEQANSKKGD